MERKRAGSGQAGRASPAKKQRTEPVVQSSWLLMLPKDLWSLIREMQGVEQAVRLALVCREALAIVKSGEFWEGRRQPAFDLSRDSTSAVFSFFVESCINTGRPLRQVSLRAPYSPQHYAGKRLKEITVITLVMAGETPSQHTQAEKEFLDEFACIYNLSTTYTSDICRQLQNRENTRSLRSLTIANQEVTDESLRVLQDLRHLRGLTLRRCGRITDNGLRVLAAMPQLRELGLQRCQRLGCVGLRDLQQLTKLTLNQPTQPERIIDQVSGLQQLRILDLFECVNVTGNNVELLKDHRFERLRLRLVSDFRTPLTDEKLRVISQLRGLQALHLTMAPNITDNGLAYLQGCPQLERLILQCCDQLEDLSLLRDFPALRTLQLISGSYLRGPPVGFIACRTLRNLQLKNYTIDIGLMLALQQSESLAHLQLADCYLYGTRFSTPGEFVAEDEEEVVS